MISKKKKKVSKQVNKRLNAKYDVLGENLVTVHF